MKEFLSVLLLLYYCLLLASAAVEKDIIKSDVTVSKYSFKCTFSFVLDNGKSVNLKKSSIACTPKKPKRKNLKNLKLSGKLGTYLVSITINPNKIKSAKFEKHTTLPWEQSCNFGYSRVCSQSKDGTCPEGLQLVCPSKSENKKEIKSYSDCSCLPSYVVNMAVGNGVSPIGCEGDCVCIERGVGQCEAIPPHLECENTVTRFNVLSIRNEDFDHYNKAMDRMKKDDSREGFLDIGTYHGRPFRCSHDQSTVGHLNGCCIDHWSQVSKRENFITWHRLYTYNMEQSLLKHSDGALAMPYWDWTSPPNSILQLPPLATQGQWFNGPKPAPPLGFTKRERNPTEKFQNTNFYRGLVKTAFKQTNYVQFNQQIVLPHNVIHVFVGGDMGSPVYASYDPVFYLHHSYVDLQFAYYQELQRLRNFAVNKKSFCKQAQEAPLQPFATEYVNPFKPSRLNSVGHQTLNYEKKFCYKYSELLFDGLTPGEFIEREEQEMKSPSILAAVAMNSTGYPSTVEFELTSPTHGSLGVGAFHNLAKGQDENFNAYNSFLVNYFDFTDIVSEIHDLNEIIADNTLKVKITNITNGHTESAFQPMIVYRPANSAQHIYRVHTDDIQKYAPIHYVQPGARLQFLDDNGIQTTNTIQEIINDENGSEVQIGIPTNLTLRYNEHKFVHSPTGTKLTIGQPLWFECDDSGVPTCDPGYFEEKADAVTVIHWDTEVHKQVVTALTPRKNVPTQILLLAWCPGQKANVQMVSEEDFNSCTNLDAGNAQYGPASYKVNTDNVTTYYFANGVPGACDAGWKVKVNVINGPFENIGKL